MNGIKFEKVHSNKELEKYNQTFTGVSKDGKRRIKFSLVLKDLTYDQLKKRMAQILKSKGYSK